jgi:SAM-dependent methyltransferase
MTEPDFLGTTRAAYDTLATDYAEHTRGNLASQPLDRAMLTGFAELVRAAGLGPVADIGCGPGHATAHLHAMGLRAFGVDLSPEMVALARQAHPGPRFDEGTMTALDVPDATLGGILARYSIIHLPTEQLPRVFAEFHRVLAPGGHLLLVFQVGDERRHRTEAYGHQISLPYYLRPPDRVAELLGQAGLAVHARMVREPEQEETVPRASLLARKPADPAERDPAERDPAERDPG